MSKRACKDLMVGNVHVHNITNPDESRDIRLYLHGIGEFVSSDAL